MRLLWEVEGPGNIEVVDLDLSEDGAVVEVDMVTPSQSRSLYILPDLWCPLSVGLLDVALRSTAMHSI